MDDAKKLLDSLMGTHRNADFQEFEKRKGQAFKEDNICKYYLVGFCPQYSDCTERQLGDCSKVHSDALKEEFESHLERDRYAADYEHKLRGYLEELCLRAEERVTRKKKHLELTNKAIEEKGPNEFAKAEIARLTAKAAELMAEAENLAEEGKISESKWKMGLSEEVRSKATKYEDKAKTLQSEEICEICGTRMEQGDAAKSRYQHDQGKIHQGYVQIRKWLADLKQRQREREEKRTKEGSDKKDKKDTTSKQDASEKQDRRYRERSSSQSRSRSRSRSRDRGRHRNRDRDRDRRKRDSDHDRRRRR